MVGHQFSEKSNTAKKIQNFDFEKVLKMIFYLIQKTIFLYYYSVKFFKKEKIEEKKIIKGINYTCLSLELNQRDL